MRTISKEISKTKTEESSYYWKAIFSSFFFDFVLCEESTKDYMCACMLCVCVFLWFNRDVFSAT